ncbi:hypothetical protein ACFH56_004751 [Escherichia coli]|uniref:hypothetical protein n=1 Tax=Enterobacteriaceae TaxID=543 RepID=UPI000CD2D0B4|nr:MULTISPECIES: hypothetical protein [Enterobacteriaceae]AUV23277.1 hypothetical protein C2U45_22335 [Escherichia coli]ELQ8006725.1 hypothetical protein [Escherichia coli]MCE3760600.1 hypothetical protein [Escherichia coli]MCF1397090.1 hypothetical protein [Escherichia coli]MDF6628329.1 hypothetical protein [Escherichia coli]
MTRNNTIVEAFRASISINPKGYQYLYTDSFISELQRRGIHFSEEEANNWISREQTYFVDKTPDHSENRLWMLANMGRVI